MEKFPCHFEERPPTEPRRGTVALYTYFHLKAHRGLLDLRVCQCYSGGQALMARVRGEPGFRQGDRVIVSLLAAPHAEHCLFMHLIFLFNRVCRSHNNGLGRIPRRSADDQW